MPVVQLQAEGPDSRRYRWRWTGTPKAIGPQWQAVDIRLEDLQYYGSDPAPFDLLSPALGQLCFITSEDTDVFIDDIVAQ